MLMDFGLGLLQYLGVPSQLVSTAQGILIEFVMGMCALLLQKLELLQIL